MSVRSKLFQQLFTEGRVQGGLSRTNILLCGLILGGGIFAILATEPTMVEVCPAFFRITEVSLAVVFSIEYVLRLYAAGEMEKYRGPFGRVRYVLTPMALIDLAAIVPLYLAFLPSDAALLRLVRLFGILRFAKLGRYSRAVQYVVEAIYIRRSELLLSLIAGVLLLIVTSTLLYLVESSVQPDKFGSIPRALWWSVATLTTVGYGDVYPISPIGKILSGLTSIVGIGLIAMPTGILAAAFSEVFQRHRSSVVPKHGEAQGM